MIAQSPPGASLPAGYGSPLDTNSDFRVPMYTEGFAADPHSVYDQVRRRYGSLVPVWLAPNIPATLVIGYWTALEILHDSERFPADPRMWERGVSPECPVVPMMRWRPNALRNSGAAHGRYRAATVDALGRVDLITLRVAVKRIVEALIAGFCGKGQAELIQDFAFPLVFEVISEMIGCDPDISAQAAAGMATMFDTNADAAEGNRLAVAALGELVGRKRARPGEDVTSWLLAHPAGLDVEEVIHQVFTLYAAASEPLTNLIVNTVSLMMTRPDFGGRVVGGAVSTRDALAHVLFRDPPIANFCMSYPRRPQLIDGVWVPAHQPIVISLAACNNDPKVLGGNIFSNESHLGLGAGTHGCPARTPTGLIAGEAIDGLLDVLPEIELAIPREQLRWRPGPFHRSLEALPVTFTPIRVLTVPTR